MNNKKGFTLVELLTVVLIIAILTAVGLPQYRGVVQKARAAEAQAMLRNIYDSGERLASEFGARSYDKLNSSVKNLGFTRLDMFGEGELPSTCRLLDNTTLECPGKFVYKIDVSGYVAAKSLSSRGNGTLFLLKRDTLQLYCQPPAGDEEGCDIYGLDTVSGVSF